MGEYLSKIKALGLREQNLNDENFRDIIQYTRIKRGMGVTIGNALRRILLRNIPGYGMRYVNIFGIAHEFCSIPGVKEDAQELIMNLKKVVFKGEISKAKASLNLVGPLIVKAGDITCSNISVVNPELVICALDKGFNLKLEMHLEKNSGIKLISKTQKDDDIELNAIPCDAFFSPIENVNFNVSEYEAEDYEDLELEILTNGSISAKDAFQYAYNLFVNQLAKCGELSGEVKQSVSANNSKRMEVLSPNLFLKIEDLPDISTRTLRCLKLLGVVFVGDLVKMSKEALMNEPNFGENSLNRLLEKLGSMGLTLDMNIPNWPPEDLAQKAEAIKNNSLL
jgi:DNA-directed RNA polymerase subunit alpha